MDTKFYDIVKGPSKDALFDACKYAYGKNSIYVDFTVAAGYTASMSSHQAAYKPMAVDNIVICSIGHEDGSGESFILQGYCNANVDSLIYKSHRFVAHYNTKKRRGKISFD